MRLKSEFWVAAYLRRCQVEGAYAVLRRRGAAEAGAIFVVVDRRDGTTALFGPAPRSDGGEAGIDRLWQRRHTADWTDPAFVESRLAKELSFDPDLWIIDVEDKSGRSFLDLAA